MCDKEPTEKTAGFFHAHLVIRIFQPKCIVEDKS